MSDSKEAKEGSETNAAKAGMGLLPVVMIVLATIAVVLGAVGGSVYWLSKSGRFALPSAVAASTTAAPKVEPPKTSMLMLEPLLVNLADQGGGGYLRVVVALEVEDAAPAKDAKPKEEKAADKGKPVVNEDDVKMRDAALAVLGRETSESLLAPEGKERVKSLLQSALSAHVSDVKVVNVMFTEFLVQR